MTDRLTDYVLVAIVIGVIFVLFRLSRLLMRAILGILERRLGPFCSDRMLLFSFMFLLTGLLFLPAVTAALAVLNNRYLFGGMYLHLLLVAVSVVLFSISEDMFREFTSLGSRGAGWPVTKHLRLTLLPFLLFWAAGAVFISPIFYSGLSLVLVLFYLFALSCRKRVDDGSSGKAG